MLLTLTDRCRVTALDLDFDEAVGLSSKDRVTWWSNRFKKPEDDETLITGKKVLVWILSPFAKGIDIKFALTTNIYGLSAHGVNIKNKMEFCLYDCVGQYAEKAWTLILENIVRGNIESSLKQDRANKTAFDIAFHNQEVYCNQVLDLDDWAFAGVADGKRASPKRGDTKEVVKRKRVRKGENVSEEAGVGGNK